VLIQKLFAFDFLELLSHKIMLGGILGGLACSGQTPFPRIFYFSYEEVVHPIRVELITF
jgi:hypothetical protein